MKDEEIEILDVEETKDDNKLEDTIIVSKTFTADIKVPNNEDQKIDIKSDNLLDEPNINSDYNTDSKIQSFNNKKIRKQSSLL